MRLFLSFCLLLLITGCASVREIVPGPVGGILYPPMPTRVARVALEQNVSSIDITVNGPGVMFDSIAGKRIKKFLTLPKMRVTANAYGTLLINGRQMNTTRILIYPDVPVTLYIGDICYRGKVEIIGKQNGKLTVVNVLPLEDYLLGVIPKETFPSWPDAALQAQAIAARTFAMHHIIHSSNKDFTLVSPMHQLYGGASAEDPRTSKAVRDTENQVLMYNGDVLCTFFHTCCGGKTEDAANVFPNIGPYPPRVTSKYSAGTPHHAWTYSVSGVNVYEKLKRAGYDIGGPLNEVRVTQRFPSGRVATMQFLSARGSKTISGEECRKILGYNKVRSTLFNIRYNRNVLYFWGRGWGHGVGLCQWSSKGMADDGYSCKKILYHFYPGAKIHRY